MVKETEPKESTKLEDSQIWSEIGRLIIRGADTEEILNIRRASGFPVNRKVIERTVESAKKRAFSSSNSFIKIVDLNQEGVTKDPPVKESLSKEIAFAGELYGRDLIPHNNSCAEEMVTFCRSNNIEMPHNFYDMLRLEMFYGSVTLAHMGDSARLEAYNAIGQQVGLSWFRESLQSEERSIEDALKKRWSNSKSGNLDWSSREALHIDDGSIIFATSAIFMIARQKQRWGIAQTKISPIREGRKGRR